MACALTTVPCRPAMRRKRAPQAEAVSELLQNMVLIMSMNGVLLPPTAALPNLADGAVYVNLVARGPSGETKRRARGGSALGLPNSQRKPPLW